MRTEVEIYRDSEGKICEFRSKVQAPDDEESKAPVQIASSALMRAAVLGLKEYLRLNANIAQDDEGLHCKLERDYFLNRETDAILETMFLGLQALAEENPEEIEIKELAAIVK